MTAPTCTIGSVLQCIFLWPEATQIIQIYVWQEDCAQKRGKRMCFNRNGDVYRDGVEFTASFKKMK